MIYSVPTDANNVPKLNYLKRMLKGRKKSKYAGIECVWKQVSLNNILDSQKCPILVSMLAILATLIVTMSVLFWNYSETRQRRLTKKQSVILDHWGKKSPLLEQEDLDGLLQGGATYYGETALR